MVAFLDQTGFLGTSATIRVDLTFTLVLISAVLFNLGVWLALKKRYEPHRWVQTIAVILNSIVVLLVMITSFIKYILPGIPYKLLEGNYLVTVLHSVIGTIGLVLGVFIVLRTNNLVPRRLQFKNYKLYMRLAYALYMIATSLGIIVYLTTYLSG